MYCAIMTLLCTALQDAEKYKPEAAALRSQLEAATLAFTQAKVSATLHYTAMCTILSSSNSCVHCINCAGAA
jgi:hypothetical protein